MVKTLAQSSQIGALINIALISRGQANGLIFIRLDRFYWKQKELHNDNHAKESLELNTQFLAIITRQIKTFHKFIFYDDKKVS